MSIPDLLVRAGVARYVYLIEESASMSDYAWTDEQLQLLAWGKDVPGPSETGAMAQEILRLRQRVRDLEAGNELAKMHWQRESQEE